MIAKAFTMKLFDTTSSIVTVLNFKCRASLDDSCSYLFVEGPPAVTFSRGSLARLRGGSPNVSTATKLPKGNDSSNSS
jgi:hypothetical protein